MEFALDPGSGKLEISVDGQKKSLDFSSLQTMAESFLSGLPEEKKAETFDAETIMRFLDNREILTEEGVHSYVDYSKGEREDISEPCTVYKLKIGWDEVSDYLSLVTDQIEDLYTSFRDFQEELSGYSPSYDTGLNLRENMESMISEIKKYAPEGLELRFSVGEEGLVGASLSARMTEDAAAAYNSDGKKLKTVKIGENQAYAGLLAEADLKRKQLTEADELELIWSLPALITVTAVDAAGDENTEYMNFGLSELKYKDAPERWERRLFSLISFQDYTIDQTYTPEPGEGLGASYTLRITPGSYYSDDSDNSYSISVREAKEQDAEEGPALSVNVMSGNESVATGVIRVKGE